MFVKSLHLLNIRSFKKTEIDFSKSINLLIGNNNSGKSTIIKALYKLQNPQSLGLDDIRKSDNYGRIHIDLEDISLKERRIFELTPREKTTPFPDTNKVKVLFGCYTDIIETKKKQDALYFDLNQPFRFDSTGKITIYDYENNEMPFLPFDGLPYLETQNNFIYPFFAKRKTTNYNSTLGARETFNVGEDLRNITSKIQKISNPTHSQNKKFTNCVNDILGFGIGVIPHGDSQSNTGIYINDNTMIPIESMGEGIVNILGLLVTLLTEDNKLYLIEEPENDIHPKALKKLLELIIEKSAHNQFIISTHSNIVVKYLGIPSAKIFHLQWQPFENEFKDTLPTSSIKVLEKKPEEKMKLLEDLGYDVFDFDLYKSYLIFEESSAETIVRDFLIPVFYPSLKDKVKTLAAAGADDLEARFHDFLRLFVFIHQNPIYTSRAWVFADGDKAGKRNIKDLREKFTTWAPEHFINFSKDNIEEFYPDQLQAEFKNINAISNRDDKRKAKIAFSKKVFEWIKNNPEEAKMKFAESAAELLEHLKNIELKIS